MTSIADTIAQRTLLWFQRNEAAAALAPDADQNLFVRLQSFADGNQVLRVFDRLLAPGPFCEERVSFFEFREGAA